MHSANIQFLYLPLSQLVVFSSYNLFATFNGSIFFVMLLLLHYILAFQYQPYDCGIG